MAELIVGIGDCRASNDGDDVLITHALGSCIAVLVHDPIAKVAGMLHYLLPDSTVDPERARRRPLAYADTGIPLLLQMAGQLGAVQSRMIVVAIGGAQMMDPHGTFNIGKRNYLAMRQNLWKAGIAVHREVTGGNISRTVRMDVSSGKVRLRTSGESADLVVDLKKTGPSNGSQLSPRH